MDGIPGRYFDTDLYPAYFLTYCSSTYGMKTCPHRIVNKATSNYPWLLVADFFGEYSDRGKEVNLPCYMYTLSTAIVQLCTVMLTTKDVYKIGSSERS